MRRLIAALLVALAPSLALAQLPTIAPTQAITDSGDRIATTAWVNAWWLGGRPLPQGQISIGQVGDVAGNVTPSGDCTITPAGVIVCTQAAGNFSVLGMLSVNGAIVDLTGGMQIGSPNGGSKGRGTINVSNGYYVNGVLQPAFTSAVGLTTAGGVPYFNQFGGLAAVASPFPNKIFMSGFKGAAPFWTQTTWADSYPTSALLFSSGPNNVQGLATCNIGIILTSSTGVPSCSSGTASQFAVVNSGGTAVTFSTMSGDCTLSGGAITCTKTAGTAFTTFATAAVGQAPGTTTNDDAAAGKVGEFMSALVGATSISTGTQTNIVTITLTAGDWDVYGTIQYQPTNASTNIVDAYCSISSTSATLDTSSPLNFSRTSFGSGGIVPGNNFQNTVHCPIRRMSVTGSTQIWLVAFTDFTVSTMSTLGALRARRVR